MKDRKAAKKIIKRSKKHPEYYTEQEVLYAKLFRRVTKKNAKGETNNSHSESGGDDGIRGEGEQPSEPRQSQGRAGLLKYCIKHGHWSVFEQAHMTLEIETTRGLAAQILRHRSFTYQEFSQRYADVSHIREDIPLPELRSQDEKNRQNSIDDVDPETVEKYNSLMRSHFDQGIDLYKKMLRDGIAKECARFVLPLATPTRLYMTGSCRSWIHYINLRSAHGTQKEHMDLVKEVRNVFKEQFPIVSEALGWV